MTDQAYYDGLAKELLGRWNRLRSFTQHHPSVGFHHEEILRATIRDLLSPRFQLRSGFSYGGSGKVSSQGDILVVDEHYPTPYLFREGDLVVVQPRALACVIEVKTRLSKKSFGEALDNLASFQAVADACAPNHHPMTFVFAFDGAPMTPSVLDRWYRSQTIVDHPKNYPSAILALKRGLLKCRNAPDSKEAGHHFLGGEELSSSKAKSLSVFLAAVRSAVHLYAKLDSNAYDFALLDGMGLSVDSLRLGKGLVPGPKHDIATSGLTPQ